ncbi:MAG TPA: hypothetical protein ENK57_22360 [Polyangiaceae bacterium]|nr:hypothetical protein [Polyangiaceae bacterium]
MVRGGTLLALASGLLGCNTLFGIDRVVVVCETGADCASGFCRPDFTCDDGQWVQHFPGKVMPPLFVEAIAGSDGRSRIVIAGSFEEELELGDITLQSAGGVEGFVAMLDDAGTTIWATRLGGPGDQWATALSADNGRILVGGSFMDGLEGGGLSIQAPSPSPATHGYVAALDPSGRASWVSVIAGTETVGITDVLDTSMGIVAVGSYVGRASLAGTALEESGGVRWGHLSGFDDAGQAVAFVSMRATGGLTPLRIAEDGLTGSAVYVAGDFAGQIEDGPSSGSDVDVFRLTVTNEIANYSVATGNAEETLLGFGSDNDGRNVMALRVGNAGAGVEFVAVARTVTNNLDGATATNTYESDSADFANIASLVMATNDDAVIAGEARGTIDLDGVDLSADDEDAFFVRIAEDGEPLLPTLRRFRGPGTDRANDVAVDGEHGVVIGTFESRLTVGNDDGSVTLENTGSPELFVSRLR